MINNQNDSRIGAVFNRFVRIMKLINLFLVMGICIVNATSSYSQSTLLSLEAKNNTLEEVFRMIEKSSEYVFFYSDKAVNLKQKVSLRVKDQTIDKILDQVLKQTGNAYTIDDRQVFIGAKNEPASYMVMQQNLVKVTGVVKDDMGETLPGVAVQIEGSPRGVTTDIDGSFSIEVKPTDKLVFTYLGMEPQTHPVGKQRTFMITLKTKVDELDEVTIVAFAKQKKESVVASVTTVKPSELKVPSSNLTTALAGRVAGVISYQRSGEPGMDDADFFVRGVTTFGYGKNPLILIDGVEMTSTDLARLNTDDIESFSIMKDANATSLYGARGANGVIYVKTKEGREGKTKVNFRAEGTLSTPAQSIDIADPITYMRMYNEATANRDPFSALPFSTKKIEMTERGTDPFAYPSIDWRKILFKENTFNQRYNISVSGGGQKVQYYVAGSYSKDSGILKEDKMNNFDNNININRYLVRSNTTMNFGKLTKATVRVHASFQDYSGPLDGGTSLYNMALKATPVLFHPYYERTEDYKYVKHVMFGNYEKEKMYLNPYAQMVRGYKESKDATVTAQIELVQDFKFITEGLVGRVMANTTRYSYFDAQREFIPYYYAGTRTLDGEFTLIPLNEDKGQDYLDYSAGDKNVNSSLYMEAQLSYNKKITERHDISGMLVYQIRENMSPASSLQASLPGRNLGLSGRFTYGLDERYFTEFNFGYNGSERFDKSHRFGFFPAIGLGYIISKEKFYPESLKKVVDNLKFKYTWGKVGNDNIGSGSDRFFYLSEVTLADSGKGYNFGTDFEYSRSGVSINRYADPNISWEIATKQDIGVEFDLFKDIRVQADYFWENRTNILMERSYIPTFMGLQAKPKSNVGESSGQGFEFSIDANKSINKDWWMSARANFTYATGKFEVYEEPDYSATPWKTKKGNKLSQEWGLIAERLFVDQYEVDNSPKQTFGAYGPGDIKYKDLNNDGIIDDKDEAPIGYPTSPEIVYGFGISTGYKGFDISCFFQGSARSSFWINPESTAPFIGGEGETNSLLQVWADNHWTEENQNIFALWPKFSDQKNENNTKQSTWFMRDGSFLRLKTVEMGYSLPRKYSQKLGMENLRLYFSANNLFCFSKFDLWDPEMAGNGLGYPLQRVYNIGLNVQF